jgi:hypothetical protein
LFRAPFYLVAVVMTALAAELTIDKENYSSGVVIQDHARLIARRTRLVLAQLLATHHGEPHPDGALRSARLIRHVSVHQDRTHRAESSCSCMAPVKRAAKGHATGEDQQVHYQLHHDRSQHTKFRSVRWRSS